MRPDRKRRLRKIKVIRSWESYSLRQDDNGIRPLSQLFYWMCVCCIINGIGACILEKIQMNG